MRDWYQVSAFATSLSPVPIPFVGLAADWSEASPVAHDLSVSVAHKCLVHE